MNLIKNIFFLLIAATLIVACNNTTEGSDTLSADVVNNPKSASGKDSNRGLPAIHFEKKIHDFGKVIQGEKITYSFKFNNTGNSDLVIASVSSSCGCTVPEFTKEAIKSGEKGTLKVTFDSSNRKGFQNKTITIVSNTHPSNHVLRIKAQVIVPEQF